MGVLPQVAGGHFKRIYHGVDVKFDHFWYPLNPSPYPGLPFFKSSEGASRLRGRKGQQGRTETPLSISSSRRPTPHRNSLYRWRRRRGLSVSGRI
ncbi:unnamed protein product [Vitrella brassicaformis CCMP3155]|uniref:Uncharacterized protein n=1 Tax=Vitrella brassicaformis (strain CCMP3155) TaxID=1169540 RepID=A0A0G4E9J3_VITBC|nr:unnamed protein product [Vitrella brassicaformis CCMP3155]|eukprot:CEL92058.1 unnamed protein product [Vitrella brassicaformis CCMP3155]